MSASRPQEKSCRLSLGSHPLGPLLQVAQHDPGLLGEVPTHLSPHRAFHVKNLFGKVVIARAGERSCSVLLQSTLPRGLRAELPVFSRGDSVPFRQNYSHELGHHAGPALPVLPHTSQCTQLGIVCLQHGQFPEVLELKQHGKLDFSFFSSRAQAGGTGRGRKNL